MSSVLPTVNASLNAAAGMLLCLGLWRIRRGDRKGHERCMLAATATSALFLVCYLWYHLGVQSEVGPTRFRRTGAIKTAYLGMLVSHVVLAVVNLPLIVRLLWLAHRADWVRHRRLARLVWPSWFYVSVTGVLVYLALYHWNPPLVPGT